MSKYYQIKPKDLKPNPKGGIYLTKEERNRTILVASLILVLKITKIKFKKWFKH